MYINTFFSFRSTDENIILASNETRIEKLDNNYYDATMTAVAQNTDNDVDSFYCFITFDGLSLNFTVNTERSAGYRSVLSSPNLWVIIVLNGIFARLVKYC